MLPDDTTGASSMCWGYGEWLVVADASAAETCVAAEELPCLESPTKPAKGICSSQGPLLLYLMYIAVKQVADRYSMPEHIQLIHT